MCLSHLIYTVRPCLINTCHATLRQCLSSQGQSTGRPSCAVALRRTAWSERGVGMAWHGKCGSDRPHCVNQMGKIHSTPLAARHGRGTAWARHGRRTAWARHGNGMLCVWIALKGVSSSGNSARLSGLTLNGKNDRHLEGSHNKLLTSSFPTKRTLWIYHTLCQFRTLVNMTCLNGTEYTERKKFLYAHLFSTSKRNYESFVEQKIRNLACNFTTHIRKYTYWKTQE